MILLPHRLTLPWKRRTPIPSQELMKKSWQWLGSSSSTAWKSRLKFPNQNDNHYIQAFQMYGFLLSSLAIMRDFPLISVSFECWLSWRDFQLKEGQTSCHLPSDAWSLINYYSHLWGYVPLQRADEIVSLSISYRLVQDHLGLLVKCSTLSSRSEWSQFIFSAPLDSLKIKTLLSSHR